MLEPGGGPGGERHGAGGGGAKRRALRSVHELRVLNQELASLEARADVVANCLQSVRPNALPRAPALSAAYGQPPTAERLRPRLGTRPLPPPANHRRPSIPAPP